VCHQNNLISFSNWRKRQSYCTRQFPNHSRDFINCDQFIKGAGCGCGVKLIIFMNDLEFFPFYAAIGEADKAQAFLQLSLSEKP
jgi:hypothetical protein